MTEPIRYRSLLIRGIRSNLQRWDAMAILVIGSLGILTHRSWFLSLDVVSADEWGYLFSSTMKSRLSSPTVWDMSSGLGGYSIGASFYGLQLAFGALASAGLGFNISERILFLWPMAIVTPLGMYYLSRQLFGIIPSMAASLLYSSNSYILLIHAGGNFTSAMAYALMPVILVMFVRALEGASVRLAVVSGLALSACLTYEARFAYIVMASLAMYAATTALVQKRGRQIGKLSFVMIIPFGVAFVTHAFWIVPAMFARSDLNQFFPSTVYPLAWIKLQNALTLYNPFWSEMVQHQEWIPTPIIPAYAVATPLLVSLGLVVGEKRRQPLIVSASLLAILGIFLVKQHNLPAGWIYEWLFKNFPGFFVFRESSKFFLLVSLSYSILLASAISGAMALLRKRPRTVWVRSLYVFILILLVTSSMFPMASALRGDLGHGFSTTTVPQDYAAVADLLSRENIGFARTFWYPHKVRFSFFSDTHPAIDGVNELFTGRLERAASGSPDFRPEVRTGNWYALPDPKFFRNMLDLLSVRYVIIPDDSAGFYGPTFEREHFLAAMEAIGLKEEFIGQLTVFTTDRHSGLFFQLHGSSPESFDVSRIVDLEALKEAEITYTAAGPNSYKLSLSSSSSTVLAFSAAYDPGWRAIIDGHEVQAQELFGMINGFRIPTSGTHTVEVFYVYQRYADLSFMIAVAGFAICLVPFLRLRHRTSGRLLKGRLRLGLALN